MDIAEWMLEVAGVAKDDVVYDPFVAGSMKNWKPDRVDRVIDAAGNPRVIFHLWTHVR